MEQKINKITADELLTSAPTCHKPMLSAGVFRVLIGCEESQTVTKSFRSLGVEAYSCDLKDCSGGRPEWHLKMDIYDAINLKKWDFIGLHPVCTKITFSGNRHYAPNKPRNKERIESVESTINLWNYACSHAKHVYMENPMGAMNSDKRLPKPQIIQPYFFGDEFQKTTCLWLKNLNYLYHNKTPNLFDENVTHVSPGKMWISKSGNVFPEWIAKSPSTNNEANRTLRSKTFPGISRAMAVQWSSYACR